MKYYFFLMHFVPPRMEVLFGGIEENRQRRMHLYWRLSEPALTTDLARVITIRGMIADKAGGDPCMQKIAQPVRIPGSIYFKGGSERAVEIRVVRAVEYHLQDLAAAAAEMPFMNGLTARAPRGLGAVAGQRRSIDEVLCGTVREGGVDGVTRFDAASCAIGHFVRQYHDGRISIVHVALGQHGEAKDLLVTFSHEEPSVRTGQRAVSLRTPNMR